VATAVDTVAVGDVPLGAVCGVLAETTAALAILPADVDAVATETAWGKAPNVTLRSVRSSRDSIDNRRVFFFFMITQLLG
jgi:hypothetical protein